MKTLFLHDTESAHGTPKVAVLISLYNYSRYIYEALDTVAAQSLQSIELIVCNDCSTDNSAELTLNWMKSHTDRFARLALIENDANSGLSATRNTSVAFAQAPYLFILDADNKLYPACLERSLEVLEESDSSAAFVYALREIFDENEPDKRSLENLADWNPTLLHRGNSIDAMVLHRKSALEAVGGYSADEHFGRLGWEDFELWFKYARAGFCGIKLHQPLVRYRVHWESMLSTTTNQQKNLTQLWEQLRLRYPEFFPEPE